MSGLHPSLRHDENNDFVARAERKGWGGRAVIALLGKRERLRQGIPRAGKVRFSVEIKPPQVLVPASGCTVRNRVRGTSHSKSRTQGWIGCIERGHDSDVAVLRRHAGKTSTFPRSWIGSLSYYCEPTE